MHQWRPAPTRLDLTSGAVHVWRLLLPELDPADRSLLTFDESERADRFRLDVHRRRFIAARAGLRVLLGSYVSQDPARIEFRYTEHGKPFIDAALSFNLSHAGDVAVYALTAGSDVGVDAEGFDPSVDHDTLAARFFSPGEERCLAALPTPDRGRAFLDCWTRKEAFVKAIGEGLSIPLRDFEISLDHAQPRVLWVGEDRGDAAEWTMASFAPATGYSGAVAVRCPQARFSFYELCPARLAH